MNAQQTMKIDSEDINTARELQMIQEAMETGRMDNPALDPEDFLPIEV